MKRVTTARPRAAAGTDNSQQLAQRVRELRAARGVTLDHLANATGLTKSYLSKIENAHKLPPIATLSRIAQALGTGIASFLGGGVENRRGACVVRKNERLPVVRGGTAFGYDYESLAHQRLSKQMEPFVFTFPSRIDRHVFFEHEGEEFVFILSGKVEFQIGDEHVTLREGDSLYFDAAVPHRGWCVGRDAKALVVVSGREGHAAKPKARARARAPVR